MRTLIKLPFIAMAAGLWAANSADAAMISVFTFDGNSSSATFSDSNVTTSAFADGDGSLVISGNAGAGVPSAFKSYTTLPDGALNTSSWFGFSVGPNTGYQLSLSTFSFAALTFWDPLNPTFEVPSNSYVTFDLRSSLDGFVASLGTSTLTSFLAPFTYDLSGVSSLQGLTQTVAFRLYMHDAGRTGTAPNGIYVDNVLLGGTASALPVAVNAVPEPSSAILIVLGSITPAAWRRWRRRAVHRAPIA